MEMGRPIVSADRDVRQERSLSPAARELIQAFDDARRTVARAEGLDWVSRIRWKTMYEHLASSDPAEVAEAVEFLEERVAALQADLPAARRRGEEERTEREWEAQALELETHLSPTALERRYAGKLVWLWHGTSTALWPQIQREGLLIEPPERVFEQTTPGFVFLTADGPHAFDFYARRAAAVLGGEPLLLRVAVPWDELSWDEDDADIPSGRVQFGLPRDVRPWEIREAGGERLQNLKASLMPAG